VLFRVFRGKNLLLFMQSSCKSRGCVNSTIKVGTGTLRQAQGTPQNFQVCLKRLKEHLSDCIPTTNKKRQPV